MAPSNPSRRRARARSHWWSLLLFLGLLAFWCGLLTILFSLLFDNFLWRITHPFQSGFAKGPWGFLLLYIMLSYPVLPMYNSLDQELDRRRRRSFRGR